jgi:hypothetical protein
MIGNVVQKDSLIYIYDEKGRRIAQLMRGSGPDDGLKGYTSTTVNVKRGTCIYMYNEKGQQVGMVFAGN